MDRSLSWSARLIIKLETRVGLSIGSCLCLCNLHFRYKQCKWSGTTIHDYICCGPAREGKEVDEKVASYHDGPTITKTSSSVRANTSSSKCFWSSRVQSDGSGAEQLLFQFA